MLAEDLSIKYKIERSYVPAIVLMQTMQRVQLELGMAGNLNSWSRIIHGFCLKLWTAETPRSWVHSSFWLPLPWTNQKSCAYALLSVWFCKLSTILGRSDFKLLMLDSLICFWGPSQSWQVVQQLHAPSMRRTPVIKRRWGMRCGPRSMHQGECWPYRQSGGLDASTQHLAVMPASLWQQLAERAGCRWCCLAA